MIYSFSILRFLGATGVFLHHLSYPGGMGSTAVVLFFIISGFVIGYRYHTQFERLDIKKYLIFLKHRIIRIYPLYFFTFLLSLPLIYLNAFKTNWKYILAHLFMVQTYWPNGEQVFAFNGVSWFVSDLMFCTILTPLILFLLHKKRITDNKVILTVFIILIFITGVFISYMFHNKVQAYSFGWWMIYVSPYYRILDYCIGLLCGLIFTSIKNSDRKSHMILFTLLECCAIAFVIITYKSQLIKIDSLAYDMYYVPAFTILIFTLAFQRGLVSKIFKFKPFVRLGELSFSFYMIHTIVIIYMATLFSINLGQGLTKDIRIISGQIMLYIIIICISYVLNRNIETPKLDLSRKAVREI